MKIIKKLRNRDYYFSFATLKIVFRNRLILLGLKNFIVEELLLNSKDKYGIRNNTKAINKFLGFRLTNIDLIQVLSKELGTKICYVEIGVSVMKNFYLLANHLENSQMFAFDINPIYEPIEKKLFRIDHNLSNLYKFNSNTIHYFEGDVHNDDDLERFSDILNSGVNFIYSDADHSEKALLKEFDYFYKNKLDKNFFIYYDDVNSSTFPAIKNIMKSLKQIKGNDNLKFYTFLINGWMGKNENQHRNAIISDLDVEKILKKNNVKLKNFELILIN